MLETNRYSRRPQRFVKHHHKIAKRVRQVGITIEGDVVLGKVKLSRAHDE